MEKIGGGEGSSLLFASACTVLKTALEDLNSSRSGDTPLNKRDMMN